MPGKTPDNPLSWTLPNNIESPVVELVIHLNNGFTINIKTNAVTNVIGSFQRKPINNKSIKNVLQKSELADTLPSNCKKYDIDLHNGNYYYADIVSMKKSISRMVFTC